MKKPDINDKKYKYFHKKVGKKMFNNSLYLDDCKKFEDWQKQNNANNAK